MRTLTEAPMAALGDRFRAARESRGLTLSDVAEQIRIRSVYLAAIEEEDWGAIGAPVYIRGFLRTYARFLGIEPEESVSEFNASSGAAGLVAEPKREFSARQEAGLSPIIWISSAVAVMLVALVIYNYFNLRRPSAGGGPVAAISGPARATPVASPSVTVTSQPSRAAVRTLGVRLLAASWLRVTVDGNVSIEGTFPAGTSRTFHGTRAVVRVGNAGGVAVTVNGKDLGPLGRVGDVSEKTFAL